MLKSLPGNMLDLLRNDFSERFGRCDIVVMIAEDDPMGLKPYAIPDQENMIILNISTAAVRNYVADEEGISFSCRFRGADMDLRIEYPAIGGVRDPSFHGQYSEVEWIPIYVTEVDITASMEPEYFEPEPPTSDKPKPNFLKVVK